MSLTIKMIKCKHERLRLGHWFFGDLLYCEDCLKTNVEEVWEDKDDKD